MYKSFKYKYKQMSMKGFTDDIAVLKNILYIDQYPNSNQLISF